MSKISILIPAYNSAFRIKECLESLSRQSSKNFTLLISDNNSSDNTVAIIEEYIYSSSHPCFLYKQSENLGRPQNFLYLLGKVDTEFFFFLDSEDMLSDDYVKNLEFEMAKNPDVDAFIPNYWELGSNKEIRQLLAPSMLQIPYEVRLSFIVTQSNLSGVAYLFYTVCRYDTVKDLYINMLKAQQMNITKSQCEDIALAWALIAKIRNLQLINNINLYHYSRFPVDLNRLLLNHSGILSAYGLTPPQMQLEAYAALEFILTNDHLLLKQIKKLIVANIGKMMAERELTTILYI
jgi:glycosyltransferase involved in cell wall biosynthesis